MIKRVHQNNRNRIQLLLSWKERHPINFDSGPSEEELKWLENKIERDKRGINK